MNPSLSIRDLGKRYRLGATGASYATLRETVMGWFGRRGAGERKRDVWALRDVDLDIAPGEVLGVVGGNGAGKSTLLRILARVTEPTTGSVELRGRVGSLLEVGTGFHPELTGRENVMLNGSVLGMSRAEILRRFDEIVAFAEVEEFLDTPVKRYSSGMVTRLAFAVAAHLEPEILLVDEVLAVGDASFQKKCLGRLDATRREGRTVLFVSHDLSAVTRLCTRAVLLEKGRLVADGSADDIVARYTRIEGASGCRRTWTPAEAPGTDGVRLESVALLDAGGRDSSAVVSVAGTTRLEIRGHADAEIPCRVAVLFHAGGTCAFVVVEPREGVRGPGPFTATVTIPPHLLAETDYHVGVSLFSSRGAKRHFVREENVVSFRVFDPFEGDSARGDYAERMLGVVRPKLEWSTATTGNLEPREVA